MPRPRSARPIAREPSARSAGRGPLDPGDPDAPLLGAPGVGPRTAERLAAHGLRTRADALRFVPRRWEDLRALTPIARLVEGEAQTTRGVVRSCRVVLGRRRFLEAVFIDAEDGDARLVARWFYFRGGLKERLAGGARFLLSGTFKRSRSTMSVVHPQISPAPAEDEGAPGARGVEEGAGIRVRYPEIDAVPGAVVARLCRHVAELPGLRMEEGLPTAIRERLGHPTQLEALIALHSFDPGISADEVRALNEGVAPPQRRLAFDELFFLQLGLARRRAALRAEAAPACATAGAGVDRALAPFLASLAFAPTAAQRRAIIEIARDLSLSQPMNRLLHGDVGSGKTVVLYAAAELAMAAGLQAAVMAPTELLAEQHARSLAPWAEAGGRRVALLTASTPRAARAALLAHLAAGDVDLIVGTHALLGEAVRFRRLGLTVIDEQHRFGVAQRAALRDKGGAARPHLLVMTATPIPRTLALTVYGDLDVTVLDEMPPGRRPADTTLHFGERGREKAHAQLARALADGRQGYVVCPLVEGADAGSDETEEQARSAVATSERLAAALPGIAVGLVHGRLPARERDEVMTRFRAGALRLLVATTVIEVGVDVPGADVMLIEGAERFGLAQLHQLRGRIGRGGGASQCHLLSSAAQTSEAGRRLAVMARTHDGFEIAEQDLKLRGAGEVYGTRQAGLPRLRYADLGRDLDLLRVARAEAFALLDADPDLSLPGHLATRAVLEARLRAGALYGEEAG